MLIINVYYPKSKRLKSLDPLLYTFLSSKSETTRSNEQYQC